MKVSKILCGCLFVLTASYISAQNSTNQNTSKRSETTVEQDYLSNVEDAIITELAASDDYDNKLVALEYLENAVSAGRASPDMVAALDSLAGEGINKLSRSNGRVMNNFPDIRAKACDLLGEIPTEASKNTLVGIAAEDKEPMVVTAAIRSLGKIGINENDEVISTIEFIHRKYAALNPTSSLALEVLNAYESLAPTVQDKSAMIQSISEIATNYRYVTPVRQKALNLLRSMQSNGSSSGKSK
ncbi:HEAT repeat domain-containing protein [Treponema rectale]|uniref:HEAT repeat domain-containing protein n=1 Tax=Treponema rectale TaxID=744512 RepID=A0A840SC95_9SPIR|nr:HEAT repeat domain-containing protein [Treponema rectale]MBB5218340.1 hypothetical protein [Treponema rectale]QOS39961.1 HEAT repeat domain-containing protein [Treponema rectale]